MKDFTAVIVAIISFAVTSLLGFIVIPYLRKLKFGQTILEEGPKWHKDKQGTPTMGGVMMVAGVLVAMVLGFTFSFFTNGGYALEMKDPKKLAILLAGIVMSLGMCAIGFFDDYIKVVKKQNLGLTAKQKTFLQLLVAAAYLATLAINGMSETYIPFIGEVSIVKGFGLLFWPIALMFIYGFTNAVNLTDGLDGLASSVTLVVACAFMLASASLSSDTRSFDAINSLSAALAGSCAGFVVWNAKPAKVFMGDTGSMFLGGMVVALSFGIERPILLLVMGCVYFIEAISVMLQVAYFKLTKKRLFKMAPLHHHFEMSGFSEQNVVLLFSFIALIGCVIALLTVIFNI
ncbi:MAG: phospho-N-acetylmuramoyl-pentapeptide-transferase [Clostridia bacterium]|nr:phospho-N-acetylmuramoyl-pentapeptide-transferase [Clostridia bacterium]